MPANIQEIILSAQTGIVAPTAITPDFVGQLYINTATNEIFFARSTAIGDYEEVANIADLLAGNILTDV